MNTTVNEYELNHLFSFILSQYLTFAPQRKESGIVFDSIATPSAISLSGKKTIIPFKKVIFPHHREIVKKPEENIALIGLKNCDLWALKYLLSELGNSDLLPKRQNMLVVGYECYPDEFCFCKSMGTDKPVDFDIYIQKNNGLFEIFSGSSKGEAILKKLKYKNAAKLKIKPVYNEDGKIDIKNISALVENRKQLEECWQGIADNCFGCGACTAVCPLCFCTRQSFTNDLDGGFKQCLDWDSCFAKRFSEIQNRVDLRSKNIDRLYNWYHHKFVRAPFEKKHFLCTGCGRCAFACPANLNIKKILRNLIDKNNE